MYCIWKGAFSQCYNLKLTKEFAKGVRHCFVITYTYVYHVETSYLYSCAVNTVETVHYSLPWKHMNKKEVWRPLTCLFSTSPGFDPKSELGMGISVCLLSPVTVKYVLRLNCFGGSTSSRSCSVCAHNLLLQTYWALYNITQIYTDTILVSTFICV